MMTMAEFAKLPLADVLDLKVGDITTLSYDEILAKIKQIKGELKKPINAKHLIKYIGFILQLLALIQAYSSSSQDAAFQREYIALKTESVALEEERNLILRNIEEHLRNLAQDTNDIVALSDDVIADIGVACDYIENHPKAFVRATHELVNASGTLIRETDEFVGESDELNDKPLESDKLESE